MEKKPKKYSYHRDATLPRNREIWVFGSNAAGRHGAGAAKAALQYGAVYGVGVGLVGQSYALPTKDKSIQTLPLNVIKSHVDDFLKFATNHPDLTFFVTRIACGLANYVDSQIAPMFVNAPINCNFAEQWQPYLENDTTSF
jgi:hypothetical protein